MRKNVISKRVFCILSGLSGLAGVLLILLSFNINPGPPPGATSAELIRFGQQLVHLAGATQCLSGWMTFLGPTILMTVSLIEITFYISALHPDPAMMPSISLVVISAVQHLYFIVAAPTLFLPLGIVLIGSSILPRLFGYLALLLASAFAALGVIFLLTLSLPGSVTAFAGVQAFWWFAAALTLIVRSGRIANSLETQSMAISPVV